MADKKKHPDHQPASLLHGKNEYSLGLFNLFVDEFKKIGDLELVHTKSMIAFDNGKRRVAWLTQVGKNFIHVVFPFKKAYPDNYCFQKVAQVPGSNQFNHHLRILFPEDINPEVKKFMKLALEND
jgi:hypothetical protein